MSGNLAAIFGADFDANAVEPQSDYDVIPPGKYPVMIEKAEVKRTRAGTGHYIGLELQVLDGPHKGRKVFDNINIDNPNPKAVEIGMRSLSALARAIGVMAISDSNQLLNQCCIASVKVKDGDNNVRTYEPIQQQQAPPQQPAYQPPQQQAPPAGPPAQPMVPPQQNAPPQSQPQQPAPQQPAANAPPWAR